MIGRMMAKHKKDPSCNKTELSFNYLYTFFTTKHNIGVISTFVVYKMVKNNQNVRWLFAICVTYLHKYLLGGKTNAYEYWCWPIGVRNTAKRELLLASLCLLASATQ